jgi:hypothetical protein
MTLIIGLALLAGSILLVRTTKRLQAAGNRVAVYAAASAWLPLLFTGLFGLGVVATVAGLMRLAGV